jgi:hypothetical protein
MWWKPSTSESGLPSASKAENPVISSITWSQYTCELHIQLFPFTKASRLMDHLQPAKVYTENQHVWQGSPDQLTRGDGECIPGAQ